MITLSPIVNEQVSEGDDSNDEYERQGFKFKYSITSVIIGVMIIYSFSYQFNSSVIFPMNNPLPSERMIVSHKRRLNDDMTLGNMSGSTQDLLSNSSYIHYEGTWTSNTTEIGTMKSGSFFLQITLDHKKPHEIVTLVLKAIEGPYVDNWSLLYSKGIISDLIITSSSFSSSIDNHTTIQGAFLSNIENGQIFKRTGSIKACPTNITLSILNNQILGSLMTSCNIQLQFQTSRENQYAEYHIIMFYTAIVSSFCLFSMLSSLWLTNQINHTNHWANSFSLATICQNSLWSIFGSIAHFFLTLNYIQYSFQFAFLTLSFILSFSIGDIKLLFLIWRLKYKQTQMSNVIQGKHSYISFMLYMMMFCSIFFITKVYFDKKYIIFAVIVTWMPQIIYCAVYDSKVFLPSYYIIFTSGFRLLIPCYFRGYSYNFFLLTPDGNTVIVSVGIMMGLVMMMFMQRFHGGRWFMPRKYRVGCEMYKTREEIEIDMDGIDLAKEECLICLQGMIMGENQDKGRSVSLAEGELAPMSNDDRIAIISEKRTVLLWKAFYFNEEFDYNQKPFYITSCHHIFHSKCIDPWMRVKEECPKCRCCLGGI